MNCHFEECAELIHQFLPDAQIFLFGSRAKGNNKPYSDCDLALDNGEKIGLPIFLEIKHAFDESNIPFLVDLVDLHCVSEVFALHIHETGKPL